MFRCWFPLVILSVITLVNADPSFQYASLSWSELNHTNSDGWYSIHHCGGFLLTDFPGITITLNMPLNSTVQSGGIGWLILLSSATNVFPTCQVKQIYARGTFICCGSTAMSLPRGSSQTVQYTSPGGGTPPQTVIPATPTVTESPRFVDVVAHGLLYLGIGPAGQTVAQLPLAPYQPGFGNLVFEPSSTFGSFRVDFTGVVTTNNAITAANNQATGSIVFQVGDTSVTAGASSAALVQYFITTNQSLINNAPTLGNTTEQLATLTRGTYFLQQQTHSFVVSASDPDGDQVSLFPTGDTWPTGATIVPLFTPYVLPNRLVNCVNTSTPNITVVFNQTTGLNDTIDNGNITTTTCDTLPPQFTDIGYPNATDLSLFRIDYTPSHDDAILNKTWRLCYRAKDVRDGVSFSQACLAIYVPAPCATFDTSLSNGSPPLVTFVRPITSNDSVIGTVATWTCAADYGIETADRTTITRVSGSSFPSTCQTSGWNTTTSVTCKALCDPTTIAPRNGGVSSSATMIEGDVITYSCHPGYNPTTLTQSYTCNSTHGFDPAERPNCIPVPCPALPVADADYTLDNGTDVTTANITCRQGYGLVGSRVATCSPAGNWTNVGRCDPLPCAPLTLPRDASFENDVTANNHTLGTLRIQCPANWTRTGTHSTQCHVNGTWTPFDVTCTPTCLVSAIIPADPSGAADNSGYVNPGTIVHTNCSTAMDRLYQGPSAFVCVEFTAVDGTRSADWNTTKGACEKLCLHSTLSPIGSSYRVDPSSSSDALIGSSITVDSVFNSSYYGVTGLTVYSYCATNTAAIGITLTQCVEGVWTSASTCQAVCPFSINNLDVASSLSVVGVLRNGQNTYLRNGTSISLVCSTGYHLSNTQQSNVTCQDGTFTPPALPSCVANACPTQALPPNVTLNSTGATSLPQSSVGSYPLTCARDTTPSVQTAVAVCQSNYTWAPITLICTPIPPTSPPTNPTNTTTEPPTTLPPTPSPTPGPSPSVAHETTSAWTNLNIALVTIGICLGLLIIISLVWLHHSNQCKCLRKNHKANVARIDGEHAAASASVGALSAGAAAATTTSPAASSVAPSPAAASRASPVAGTSDIEFAQVVTTGARNDPVESDYVIVLTGGGVNDKAAQAYEHQTIDVVANADERLPIG